jgi:hypothetical protein
MHTHGFRNELALDRQSQLFRDAGLNSPAAAHVAMHAASRRAETAKQEESALLGAVSRLPLNPASRLAFVLSAWRRTTQTRPRLSAV